jgi:hypothetical protein
MMYDESLVITYADDTSKTWFSIYDGSSSGAGFAALDSLSTATYDSYDYAHCSFATGDTAVAGTVDYYLPHEDTCVLIERFEICNNRDTSIRVHVGEAIDWDIPDASGDIENLCSSDGIRQEVYQFGTPIGSPEADFYGTVSFCHDIPGAIVLECRDWVYPNSGFEPVRLGGLLARQTGFEADCDTARDLISVYVVAKNLTLEPDSCAVYCMVKASGLTGLADLQDLIDRGFLWLWDHEIDCGVPSPCDTLLIGDVSGDAQVDIDDVVQLIWCIFFDGCLLPESDADCSCFCDIDDVVYLVAFIFSGGPAPCSCREWLGNCGLVF